MAAGRLVAQGTPEDVAKVKASHTGRYLAEALKRHAERGGAPKKLKAAPASAPAPKLAKRNGKKAASG